MPLRKSLAVKNLEHALAKQRLTEAFLAPIGEPVYISRQRGIEWVDVFPLTTVNKGFIFWKTNLGTKHPCLGLQAPNGEVCDAVLWLPFLEDGVYSLSFWGCMGRRKDYYESFTLSFIRESTTERIAGPIIYERATDKGYYKDKDGVSVHFHTEEMPYMYSRGRGRIWNFFKLTLDFKRKEYVEFQLNERKHDLRGKSLRIASPVDKPQTHIEIYVNATPGETATFYVYDMVVSRHVS